MRGTGFWKDNRKQAPCRAFVLGGGGARGALQVGALRALLEIGLQPDLWVGTSAGAANATYLAVHGFTVEGVAGLASAWHDTAEADLLPANYLWLTVRILFNRAGTNPGHRMRDFFVAHGVNPDLRFGQIEGVRLILVATDLKSRRAMLYGTDPEQSVLEGLLASTTLPPWVQPRQGDGRLLIDGGVVSNLPIEPALTQGATEIVALDLADPRMIDKRERGFGSFLNRLTSTVEQRQIDLELALARAHGVPVRRLVLQAENPVALWDFRYADELIEYGYALARREIARWTSENRPRWRKWLARLGH